MEDEKIYNIMFAKKVFETNIYSVFGLRIQKHGPGPDTNPDSPEA